MLVTVNVVVVVVGALDIQFFLGGNPPLNM